MSSPIKGLKGIMAADSTICRVDGTEGRLVFRGYSIDDLASNATYEEVVWLLLKGELPSQQELTEFQLQLGEAAILPQPVTAYIETAPATHPMAILRTAVSILGTCDTTAEDGSDEANLRKAVRLIATLPTIVAAIRRVLGDKTPVTPDPERSRAEDFIRMLNGRDATADETRSMDLILTVHAEHGFNASTFTARVIAATLTDMYSAVTGAIGALKGKLHGGANTEVLRTLQKIGSVEAVADWVSQAREAKKKFMGFGHAVYQVADPRAKFLKEMSARLAAETGDSKWYDMSVEMERHVVAAINRQCNVDFYSASVQHYLGVPAEVFTCVFAASRVSGWCAHILEQVSDNKIIRPSSNYVGPELRPWQSLGSRS